MTKAARRTLSGIVLPLVALTCRCTGDPVAPIEDEPVPEVPMARLVVHKQGEGSGSVVADQGGLDCGTRCSIMLPRGTRVVLSAVPARGSSFSGWSGACDGTDPCEVILKGPHSVVARFDRTPIKLTVKQSGPGQGRIVSEPAGIDCGASCSQIFPGGTTVRLRVQPEEGSYVAGWSAPCAGRSALCEVPLSDSMEVEVVLSPRVCPSPGFCFDAPLPHGFGIYGVWGSSSRDVWAVGQRGTVLRYGGIGWVVMASGSPEYFTSVWGSGPDDVWIVSDAGRVLHYDGAKLKDLGQVAPRRSQLFGSRIWGAGRNDVWIVGDQGAVVRYTGGTWLPVPSGTSSGLSSIWGTSSRNIWAAGDAGTLLRYDGTRWSTVESGTTRALRALWGAQENDVWIVGEGGTVLRYRGRGLEAVVTPGARSLASVFGTSAGGVWITSTVGYESTTLLHHDGARISEVTVPQRPIYALWGESERDIWGVGLGGTLVHYDGREWRPFYGGVRPAGAPATVNAISGTGEEDIWAVGEAGLIMHRDGAGWSHVKGPGNATLRSVWAITPSDTWFAGDQGTLLHHDGSEIRAVSIEAPLASLRSLWASGPGDVWLAGSEGAFSHDGSAWRRVLSPSGLSAILGVGTATERHIFVGGRGVMRIVGGDLPAAVPLTKTITALSGQTSSDVWAIDSAAETARWDGTAWKRMGTPFPSGTPGGLWSAGPSEVWATGGNGGRLGRFDGRSWQTVDTGLSFTSTCVFGTGPGMVWVGGEGGTILRAKR